MVKLTEVPDNLNNKRLSDVQSTLRCNSQFDGYVYMLDDNGKFRTGAFIKYSELENKKLIPTPDKNVFYYSRANTTFKLASSN